MQITALLMQIKLEISPEELFQLVEIMDYKPINLQTCKFNKIFFVNIHIKQKLNITHKKYPISSYSSRAFAIEWTNGQLCSGNKAEVFLALLLHVCYTVLMPFQVVPV